MIDNFKELKMYAELTRKTCTKCITEQPISQFNKNERYADGYLTWCKACKLNSARNNPDTNRNWVASNKESVSKSKHKYVTNNQEKVTQAKIKWRKENPKKALAYCIEYQAAKIQRTPQWLTDKERKDIETFYVNCPKGYEVDHILPLRGKTVSGLHVLTNLQYLLITVNRKKSNKC